MARDALGSGIADPTDTRLLDGVEAIVCIVLFGASIDPSWNPAACGGFIGNEPAGHKH